MNPELKPHLSSEKRVIELVTVVDSPESLSRKRLVLDSLISLLNQKIVFVELICKELPLLSRDIDRMINFKLDFGRITEEKIQSKISPLNLSSNDEENVELKLRLNVVEDDSTL